MKKNNRVLLGVIAVLLACTALLAWVHQATRTQEVEGAVLVEQGKQSVTVALSELDLAPVTGTVVNGKGEEKPIDGDGVPMARVLEKAGFFVAEGQSLRVASADEYAVSVSAEELAEPDRVYLLVEEEGARLIVFGDADSKRNVKNVVRLTVE